ncbi:MAG: hypothetical protein AABW49_03280 [Nanoarchaeota archaeon]
MKAVSLISGGFDSAVASAVLLEKNVELIGVHFSIEPFTDNAPEEKTKLICKKLGIKRLYVIQSGEMFAELTKKCDPRLYFILSKRLMYRIASELAKKYECDIIVTGESLGQVSSQTLKNLSVLSNATSMMVIRPLLAWDKDLIIKKSRELGLYNLCSGPEVCDQLGPKHPATGTSDIAVKKEEGNINIDLLIKDGVKHAQCFGIY